MSKKRRPSIKTVAENVIKNCVKPKSNESILILSDEQRKKIAQALYDSASPLTNPLLLLCKKEFPGTVNRMIREANAVIILSSEKILTHTLTRKLRKRGIRIIRLPGVDEEIFRRAVAVDYSRLSRTTQLFAKKLEGAKKVEVSNEKGTKIEFGIERKPVIRRDGTANKMGELITLPDGEACVSPVEKSPKGIIIVDGSINGIGKLKEEIELHVREGRAFIYSDNKTSQELNKIMDKFGPCFSILGKFGLGTNPQAELRGTREDSKVLGTANFGLGENRIFGGTNACDGRTDLVIKRPTVRVDGKTIMKQGQIEMKGLF